MRKRVLSCFLALLMFVMMIPTAAFAVDNIVKATSSKSEVAPGEELSITVTLPNVSSLGAVSARLQYDNTKVKYDSASKGSAVLAGDLYIDNFTDDGYVSILVAVTDDETYNLSNTLCTIKFMALEGVSGDIGLNLNVSYLYDFNGGTLSYTVQTDSVTINAPHTHTIVKKAEVPATCETAGTKEYWICSDCGKMFSDAAGTTEITAPDTIPAAGHKWGTPTYEWTTDNGKVTATRVCASDASHKETETVNTTSSVTKAATCEAKGETTYTATFTNSAFAAQTKTVEDISATGHDWGEWVVTTPATESTEGEKTRTCKNDSAHVETTSIPKLDHVHALTKTEKAPATCTEAGTEEYWTCSSCGKKFSDAAGANEISAPVVIPATGHDWAAVTYTWAADNGSVTAERVCNHDASHVETETVSTTSTETTPATCDAKGVTTYTATFTTEGFASQTKTVENIPALGHDLTFVAEVGAGCETTGTTAHYVCSRCHKLFADASGNVEITDESILEIPALGHEWGEWVETTPATETSEGEKTRTCQRDASHEEKVSIPKLTHTTHVLTLVDQVDATCETEGKAAYYVCSGCSLLFKDASGSVEVTESELVIPALGHDWGEWVETTPATETEKGMETRTCQRDASHVETKDIPAKGSSSSGAASASVSYQYQITDGANTKWTKGSGEDVLFTSTAEFAKFLTVKVDGNVVGIDGYVATSGSTKITLKSSYLETLTVADHVITIVSNDGEASTQFTVLAANSARSPKTEGGYEMIWIALACMSLAGFAGVGALGRRKYRYERRGIR